MAASGVISFARFMELALDCPVYGFYEQERDTIGRRGDYYTSVSVGSLFGELLAFQIAEWLVERGTRNAERRNGQGTGGAMQIVEAGAHDGRLARDILSWLRLRRPALFEQIEYAILEPSERRQKWQKEMLSGFVPHVRWFDSLQAASTSDFALRTSQFAGVLFSNELLDALPVHRLGWDAKERRWFEWGVGFADGRFVWTRMSEPIHDSRFTFHVPRKLLNVLPDGCTMEICSAAATWWREAAGLLRQGKLLTLDYGLMAEDFFVPHRAQGTLRAYHRHRPSSDVLANVGEQDITAHVNFTAIQSVGETAGLETEAFVSQAQFLTGIAQRAWQEGRGFSPPTPGQTRQLQTLIHPEHLGRAFRVLVQSR